MAPTAMPRTPRQVFEVYCCLESEFDVRSFSVWTKLNKDLLRKILRASDALAGIYQDLH